MSRNRYTVTAPDGTVLECTSPDYIEHALVVIGLMRLRRPLPKVNPDDDQEEVRYDRFRQWILIGGAADEARAQKLADTQLYRGITDEVRFVPVTPIKVTKGLGDVEEDDEPEAAPLTIHEAPAPPPHVNPEATSPTLDPAAAMAVDLDAID